MRPFLRTIAVLLSAALSLSPAYAFQTPLSDESIREAYFLGQRHDDAAFALDKYKRHLAPQSAGPYISAVEFLTPFARATQVSSQHGVGYSAQRPAKEHHQQHEIVSVTVEVTLAKSYPAPLILSPGSESSHPRDSALGFADFWHAVHVRVLAGDRLVSPTKLTGHPNHNCSFHGGCWLTGATIQLEFPADLFTSDSAQVHIIPPEGSEVRVDFDLSSLR